MIICLFQSAGYGGSTVSFRNISEMLCRNHSRRYCRFLVCGHSNTIFLGTHHLTQPHHLRLHLQSLAPTDHLAHVSSKIFGHPGIYLGSLESTIQQSSCPMIRRPFSQCKICWNLQKLPQSSDLGMGAFILIQIGVHSI